jgi:nucleotide-binding universal stress UspA family protein
MRDLAEPLDARPCAQPRRVRHEAALRGRTVLLATDASPAATAAAHVTHALMEVRGAVPHVVHAFDTSPAGVPFPIPSLLAAADTIIGPEVHVPDAEAVRTALGGTFGGPVDWPVDVGVGAPAAVIAHHAVESGAALIVMGLRHHGRVDRMLHDETTLNVVRLAPCPVLGVTPALAALPRCAVVGMDFGAAAVRAARAACDVLASDGRLVLAFVEALGRDVDLDAEDDPESIVYALGVDAAFDRVITDLGTPAGVTVERVCLSREDGRSIEDALRATADAYGADLIAVGRRRHDLFDRLLVGSVTTDLVRDGSRPLLVVPPPA